MILTIKCLKRNSRGKEDSQVIQVPLNDIKISDFQFFLELERKLNTLTKGRFHIDLKDK